MRSGYLIERLETGDPGTLKALGNRLELLKQKKISFDERFKKYGQGGLGPTATGATPCPHPPDICALMGKK